METEPSEAAIGADDEVMNHAFKLRAKNEESKNILYSLTNTTPSFELYMFFL